MKKSLFKSFPQLSKEAAHERVSEADGDGLTEACDEGSGMSSLSNIDNFHAVLVRR